MDKKVFPIGFWNTAPATKFGVDGVKDWYDFGATLTMTGFYELDADKEKMIAILDECYENNIKILFVDRRIDFRNFRHPDFTKHFERDINDFGSHPAVYGFYLGDEPSGDQIEDAIELVRLFKEKCPDKEPFINLLPWVPWSVKDDPLLLAESNANYKDKLVDFVKRSGIKILCFDCYFQLQGRKPVEKWVDVYFRNLQIYKQAAIESGAELWFTTLSTGHGGYRCPTQDEFRWEINTAVAHGVEGLLYWFMYAEPYNFNYRCHPINQFNERTDTFRWLSTENRIFQMTFGTLFTELTFDKVYHVHKAYGGTSLLEDVGDEYVAEVKTYDEDNEHTPAILSRFEREGEPDKYYYALVNNSTEKNVYAYVKFKTDVDYYQVCSSWDKVQAVPNPEKWRKVPLSGPVKKNTEESIKFCCSPGQMWVFAVGKQGEKKDEFFGSERKNV